MKVFSLVILFIAFSQSVVAQTTECSSVPKAVDRLACYDRAMPPSAKMVTPKTPSVPDKAAETKPADQAPLGDMLAAENSKLDAKINNICRGC
jgi:hypothetical protein